MRRFGQFDTGAFRRYSFMHTCTAHVALVGYSVECRPSQSRLVSSRSLQIHQTHKVPISLQRQVMDVETPPWMWCAVVAPTVTTVTTVVADCVKCNLYCLGSWWDW